MKPWMALSTARNGCRVWTRRWHSRYTCSDSSQNSLDRFSSAFSQSQSPQCAALEWQSHILAHAHGPQVLIQRDLRPLHRGSHRNAGRYLLKSTQCKKTQCFSCFLEFASSSHRVKVFSVTQALRGEDNYVRGHWNRNPTIVQTDSEWQWLPLALSIKDLAAPSGRLDPLCKKRATLMLRGWWSQRKLISAEGGADPEDQQRRLKSVVLYGISHCCVFIPLTSCQHLLLCLL